MLTRGNRDQRVALHGSDGFAVALLVLIASLALTLLGWRFLEVQAQRTVTFARRVIEQTAVPAVPIPSPDQLPWRADPAIQFLLAGLGVSFMLFGVTILVEAWRRARRIPAQADLSQTDSSLRTVIDAFPDAIFTFDDDGRIQTCNAVLQEFTGLERDALIGKLVSEISADFPFPGGASSPSGASAVSSFSNGLGARGFPTTAASPEPSPPARCTIRRPDGSTLNADVFIRKSSTGAARLFTAVLRRSVAARPSDFSREAEQVFNLLSCAVPDGLWDWNLRSSRITFSPRWKTMLGHSEQEISDQPSEWFDRVHPEDRDELQARLIGHLQGQSQHIECEHRMRHRDGSYRWVLARAVAVRDLAGNAIRVVGSQADVTARKNTERRLLRAVLHDPLTGLPNRSYFMQQLENAHQKVGDNSEYLFALLFLNIDRFKRVNESLGQGVGDELLISVAKRLERCVRPGDVVARLGGDEFAVLLSGLKDRREVTRIAERIQTDLAKSHTVSGQEVFIAVSIGIALSTGAQEKPDELVRHADKAMHRAKSRGTSHFELFDRDSAGSGNSTMHLESELRRALEAKQLVIHYQPIVSLASGKITSCEALIRWQHPERGLIQPAEFIGEAEESGLITPISEWLLQEACGQAQEWREAGLPPIRISINVSPRFIKEPQFLSAVNEALSVSGLDPSLLQLELTESALMENSDATVRPLIELYTRGVQISLDDFGTGYSSLIYLRRYPISSLKIDESLVRNIASDPGDAAIASGLIALAHSLDMKVIIEGVETAEQLAFLHAKHCDEVQGFFLSPPVDTAEFFQLLKSGHDLESLLSRRAAAAHG